MMNNKIVVLAVMILLVMSSSVFAGESTDFSVLFDLDGVALEAPETLPAVVHGKGVSGLDLNRGFGLAAYDLTNGFSANEWVLAVPSLENAIAEGKYFEFGLVIDSNFSASLATLDLSLRRSALNAPMNYEVQVSLDGFATPGVTIAQFTYLGRTSGSAPSPNPVDENPYYYMEGDLPGRANTQTSVGDAIPTIDLTGFTELTNIAGGTEVTFRLYAWGNSSTAPTNTVALGRMQGPVITGQAISN